MKFLIDAQLPYRLATFLREHKLDIKHTDDLPKKERTTDHEIAYLAHLENRIVITKDSDFLDSYHLKKSPRQLLLVTTGNIKNKNLLDLFNQNLEQIISLFQHSTLVELNTQGIIVHE